MGTVKELYTCVSCGASLSFSSATTQVIVCGTCDTAQYRYDGDVLLQKPFPVIKNSNDVIRPGTTGRWQGKAFRILGRMQFWFDDGVVNFWTVLMEDDALQYLSEGYGLYAMLVKLPVPPAINLKSMREAGERTGLDDGKKAVLESISRCTHYRVEGEVWDAFFQENPVFYDFAKAEGGYLTLAAAYSQIVAFEVYDCSFQQLALQQLNTEAVLPRSVTCSRCKKKTVITTWPYAQSYGCTCGQLMWLEKDGSVSRKGFTHDKDVQPVIPPGKNGVLKGVQYTVIGFAVKQDNTAYKSKWREYVLYNREDGYAFLNEYNGHWIYSREKAVAPVISDMVEERQFQYHGTTFLLYNRYGYKVMSAVGEFPGKAFGEGYTRCREFINPPYMWAEEEDSKEQVSYYLAEHVARQELIKGFGADLPDREGMGVLAPPHIKSGRLFLITLLAALLLYGVHMLTGIRNQGKVVAEQMYQWADSAAMATPQLVTDNFTLNDWRNNLEFTTEADVNDSWMEADFEVVNAKTGKAYGLTQGVEYYHGYEDGESWSEGSPRSSDIISGLPAGTYFVRTQLTQNSASAQHVQNVAIKVRHNVPVDSNFTFLFVLLLIWPVVTLIRVWLAERARWYDSDYSPYTYE